MKIIQAAFFAAIVGLGSPADAKSLRTRVLEPSDQETSDHDHPAEPNDELELEEERRLQAPNGANGCWGDSLPAAAWHPNYGVAWPDGHCTFTVDCDSPAFSTELACCKSAYAGQTSGACLASLPSPPTTSPTATGGLDVWYPDYMTAWTEAGCINDRPLPSGRPTYSTMLACCKGAYGGQVSGACLASLPSPPTSSPTTSAFESDFWYPDYDTAWSEAGCSNKLPLPFNNPNDRPQYATQLECCKAAYGGQMSGACLSQLASPPTTAPTGAGGLDVYYPDYDRPWTESGCINDGPLPSGRPTYSTMLECCKGAYGGQVSGTCLAGLPSPPTSSPTDTAGVGDLWYPDYDTAWSGATCSNAAPLPFTPNSRPTYDSMLECCKGAYGGQQSGACLAALPSPPTQSPTGAGGLDVFYPDYAQAWPQGVCINDGPLPSGRPTYSSKDACCSGAYGGQTSQVCMCDAVGVCHSCECGTQQERDDAGCSLTCS